MPLTLPGRTWGKAVRKTPLKALELVSQWDLCQQRKTQGVGAPWVLETALEPQSTFGFEWLNLGIQWAFSQPGSIAIWQKGHAK
ncbi:hypothetical protein ACFQFS_09575 [Novosphingobium lubricantis]|jgi:hypothetical protein